MIKRLLTVAIIVCYILTPIAAYGQDIKLPEPSKEFYVNDFAGIISEDAKNNMLRINSNYGKTKERPQIVVVTVKDMQGLDENSYSVKLFENWKIGNEDYDNGVLVLLALEERRIKIEVGYGLEGAITDSKSGRILDASLKYLSDGDYSTGLENIFYNLAKEINDEYGYDSKEIFGDIDTFEEQGTDLGPLFKLLLLIFVIIIINGFGGGRKRRRGIFFIPPVIGPRFTNYGSGTHVGGNFGGGFKGGFGGGGRSGGGGAGRGF